MIWLTGRQFRTAVATVYALVAGFAVALALTGPRLIDMARAYPTGLFDQLTKSDHNLYNAGLVLVAITPAIIGVFWGAPMVARELEAGTHRLVWSQSVTRTRWLATKLAVTAAAAAGAVGVLTLAVSWWASPLDGATADKQGSLPRRITPVAFAMRGVAPIGYTVFALVLGVAVGLVLRRTLPAMAMTLILFAVVQITVPLLVRPHLQTPVTQTATFSLDRLSSIRGDRTGKPVGIELATGARDWVVTNETVDATGRAAALPAWMVDCVPGPDTPSPTRVVTKDRLPGCLARLNEEGYRQRLVYQPAEHFWALQWAETALYFSVSGLLAWFCFWWTRRRLA